MTTGAEATSCALGGPDALPEGKPVGNNGTLGAWTLELSWDTTF